MRLKVVWEISTDNQFKQNLKTGMVETSKSDDFTVKVDAAGLQADTVYYYRFKLVIKFHRLGRRKHYQHPPIK
ncbi:PhoD-like phosphatase N-terminal domain-containing protein [Klebsiella pneumoniae]|uniref:PhoD-like phosphatase N-terminal domain-containing protein n=1 Tax=Klebsiella pneumoniae TaxID=573 RepID=UPI001C9A8489